jgi:Trypsin-co-occurring domain 1
MAEKGNIMSDAIRSGTGPNLQSSGSPIRRLVPMQVGSAVVYVEQVGEPAVAEEDDRIRPVAVPTPQEAFENAGEILHECVRVIGEKIEALGAKARPDQMSVEFSLNFEVKGKAALIPVFVTGETGAKTGLKVTAMWKNRQESKDSKDK